MRLCFLMEPRVKSALPFLSAVQLPLYAGQRGLDDAVHVVILVLAQAAAEDDVRAGVGQRFVAGVQRAVLGVVDGVIRLVAGFPLGRTARRRVSTRPNIRG